MELLAEGREAEVFALDEHRVLRRFRSPDRDAGPAAGLLDRLAGLGYPVPRVLSYDGPDLVQERVHGPRMSEAMTTGALALADGARMLASLHDRLHALPDEPAGSGALLHLDLHPENVLIGQDGPVVIDWSNARHGPPGLDVAMSGLILTQVAVARPELGAMLAAFVRTYLSSSATDPTAYVDEAVALRRSDPFMTAAELDEMEQSRDLLVSLCRSGG
ncbi:phosphotransferase [Nocardioides cynanchi]|uniref:phosphotransferase n=1 Tax=Nocardioides cynanchi TaxID=2558918 RepID=UPI0012464694|nr:phosphotransferase [Nocardioides cynanchi]